MSQREITRKYNALLNDVATKDYYKLDLTNRVNCYTCQYCGTVTKTKDVDSGVTPFIIGCPKCQHECYSAFYKDTSPALQPSFEWYRPDLKRTLKLKDAELEHVLNGGLLMRPL